MLTPTSSGSRANRPSLVPTFLGIGKGNVGLMPRLTRQLSETAGRLGETASAHRARTGAAIRARGRVRHGNRPRSTGSCPQTCRNRVFHNCFARASDAACASKPRERENRCDRCGATLAAKRRKYCSDCFSALPAMASEYARIALKRRQRSESGAGPSAETRQLMGDARSRRAAEMRAWEAAHPVIPASHSSREVFPTLAGVRAPDLRDATGLSISYCRRVLRGQYIPHPMHWEAIKALSRNAE